MTSFSIDDVRETLRADVTRLLSQIERNARDLLASPPLVQEALDARPSFGALGDDGHAIYGTCALVSASSLATSARMVEDLAARGEEELGAARRHGARARVIADTLVDAASELRSMLTMELDHRGDDAEWLALEWQERARAVLADSPKTPPAPDDLGPDASAEAFDAAIFEDDASGAKSASGDDTVAIDGELAEIFKQEARESLVALQGHINALAADNTDLSSVTLLERLYHTLKGASATVGLVRVSERASDLQERMERVLENNEAVHALFVSTLVRDTNVLLEEAGLPKVALSTARRANDAAPKLRAMKEARLAFVDEAQAIYSEASVVVDSLATASGEVAATARAACARLFHRLKGSALVAQEEEVGSLASGLEEACESAEGPVTTATLNQGLARIASALGLPLRHELANGAATAAIGQEDQARAVFVEEARQIYREATILWRDFANASGSTAFDVQESLAKLFHRLKGSALIVAEETIGKEAAALEELCTADAATGVAPSAIQEGLARIGSLLPATFESSVVAPPVEATAPQVEAGREVVPPIDPELWGSFTQECAELLDALDRAILQLDESERPREPLSTILRHYHTLKGVVNTIGLAATGRTLHRVEDFLESLVDARVLPPVRSVATFLLQVQVEVRKNLKQAERGYVEVSLPRVEARLAKVLRAQVESASPSSRSRQDGRSSEGLLARDASENAGGDGADRKYIRVATGRLDALMNLAGELVVNRSRLLSQVDVLRSLQRELGRGGRRLVESVEKFREENEFANLDGRAHAPSRSKGRPAPKAKARAELAKASNPTDAAGTWSAFSDIELDRYSEVHVLSRTLAEITNDFDELHGELGRGLARLTDDSDAFGGIVSGIQGEITRARMVPLESLFTRLRLPIRDAATREHKEVRVATVGEDVNLDKTIADALFPPMLHLVRNAVAHGVESAEGRARAGKAVMGTVTLRAHQELGQVVIEVHDDGAGLDLARLHARGVALGLVPQDMPIDHPAVKDLVFAAGLSTVALGSVAGRGVGCDVVRRAVERLNGSLRVETAAGRGTTFFITLPLTLAITRALLVRDGGQTFAVPLYFAERIIDPQAQEIVESAGVRRIKVDGVFAPVKRMGELHSEGGTDGLGPVLSLRVGNQRVILQVDAVVGQEEIVVKSLGEILAGHPLFAGVTIRGNGDLVLILDVPALAESRGVRADAGTTVATFAPLPEAPPGDAPRSEVNGAAPPRPAAPERPIARAASGRTRVLFVDDSLSVRKVAEMNLTGLGCDVTLAVDGLDALAKLRDASFDIVFTDLEMPRMHGYELIRELRFLPVYKDLPVVVVTSRSAQKHQDQARQLGASDYLTKPFTVQSLEGALRRFTRAPRQSE